MTVAFLAFLGGPDNLLSGVPQATGSDLRNNFRLYLTCFYE